MNALLAALIVLGLFVAGLVATELGYQHSRPDVTCQEDESCWDCRTMGNRRCGPGAPHPAGQY